MKRKLIASNTFKTKDKKPVSFEIYKYSYGTVFIIRGDTILFKVGCSSRKIADKEHLKRIKKAVREFIKKETLYTFVNKKWFLGDNIESEFADCLD